MVWKSQQLHICFRSLFMLLWAFLLQVPLVRVLPTQWVWQLLRSTWLLVSTSLTPLLSTTTRKPWPPRALRYFCLNMNILVLYLTVLLMSLVSARNRHMMPHSAGCDGIAWLRRYCILGDGCNMEGISNEAASMAGHWELGKLIALYDDNRLVISCTVIL